MAEKKQGIDWTTLWKKDDWMSVWIGFLILIIFIAGATLRLPGWRWMTDGAFLEKAPGWVSKVDALGKEAEAKGEEGLKAEAAALKTALDAKDRKGIGEAAGKLEKAVKDVKDKDLGKKADSLAKDIKGNAGVTVWRVFSGDNLLRALYLLIGFWILGCIGMALMGMSVGKFTAGFPIVFILSALAFFVAGNTSVTYYGLEVVFWALLFGLFISNVIGVPEWLKTAVKTEFFHQNRARAPWSRGGLYHDCKGGSLWNGTGHPCHCCGVLCLLLGGKEVGS